MHELLLADEITLQAYALASFKMYEKVERGNMGLRVGKGRKWEEQTYIWGVFYC